MTACFFGEGAIDEGEFHESMNLAALWDLPVLFCCENNRYSMGVALELAESADQPRDQGRQLRDASVDRSTAWTCSRSRRPSGRRSTAIRGGGGPHFLELQTYRFRAHSMYDPDLYRSKEEIDALEAA